MDEVYLDARSDIDLEDINLSLFLRGLEEREGIYEGYKDTYYEGT